MNKIRLIALFFLLFIFFLRASFALPAFEDLYKKAKNLNSGMKDCQAKIDLKFKVKILLTLHFGMNGEYFYKYPDKYKIKLKKTPSYLQKYPQIFNWAFPDPKSFNCKVERIAELSGKNCYIIGMFPKEPMGDLIKHEIWIEEINFTMFKQVFYYNNASKISVFQNYQNLKNYWVFNTLFAEFTFPKINL
ncbi:MAG: hypothetical protein HYU63_04485, partial [Armatimonadetes bacterium]|nr:hypothetical protein [Armatimonadota bacterium]